MKRIPSHPTLVTSVATAAAALLLLTACGTDSSSDDPTDTAGDGGTRTVSHVYGETEIPADPTSVVSVSVTSTATLLSLDVPVTASSTTSPGPLTDDNGFFSQWADLAVEREVEPLPGPEVSLEAVGAAGPDLIVGNGFGADSVDESTYEQLSEIAPTVVLGEGDVPWTELTEQYGDAFDRQDLAAEIAQAYEELVTESSEALSHENDVVMLTGTPDGFNVFTPASAQGKLLADLGLTQHEMPEDLTADGAQGGAGRTDIVQLSPERASDFDDSTLLFVNMQGEEITDYVESYPTLENVPAYEDDRVFTVGAEGFRLDYYSSRLISERLVEHLG
ncbi:Fe2+-enterobactin ABC transporter substrate-binding protein [Nocardiopsis sp. JB363]|uniref:Fe2+-enterobactin ABC transporter substrate-binding protein n=1 Tax=Nocardiopsis sp. JB363 TaxID=1434837 RepID=UPI000979F920|nr:Fe2+-enterobactin ABC transporter substrate-binding protein [Nocardiopsis sp. JB363]SIO85503.1 Ferric enterobactin-binding periplasmic protein FepB (TC 3.A.1.14.2) [Nocardiopsis sp. JB363]